MVYVGNEDPQFHKLIQAHIHQEGAILEQKIG